MRDAVAWRPGDAPPEPPPAPAAPASEPASVRPTPLPPAPAPFKPAPPLEPGALANLDKATARRFRAGELPVEARLDLHGMTQSQAFDALARFVPAHHAMGRRCVLVITGKGRLGGGVLKESVPRWLNEAGLRRMVVAIASAQPRHGGDGALYLLLRRRRD